MREANDRVNAFQDVHTIAGFVASDFSQVYQALKYITETHLAQGNSFCEWGSGLGVVACLAAMAGYDSCGIEISGELVAEARKLADDFDLPVEFYEDSIVPEGGERLIESMENSGWMTTHDGRHFEENGVCPASFDLIFAYPWPGEEEIIEKLFEKFATVGAILFTFNGREGMRLQRKTRK